MHLWYRNVLDKNFIIKNIIKYFEHVIKYKYKNIYEHVVNCKYKNISACCEI
jgi:hypothetical protein